MYVHCFPAFKQYLKTYYSRFFWHKLLNAKDKPVVSFVASSIHYVYLVAHNTASLVKTSTRSSAFVSNSPRKCSLLISKTIQWVAVNGEADTHGTDTKLHSNGYYL